VDDKESTVPHSENAARLAHDMRPVLQQWGGAFMMSDELADVERRRGFPARTLYVRGRSAVLGNPPPAVVAELFGIFPAWLFERTLPAVAKLSSAEEAVAAYQCAGARWAQKHLRGVADAERLGELLSRLVGSADGSGLALFAGWQAVTWPVEPVERLRHGLTVLREYRGGLHFAALRAVGLTVGEALVADPEGGRVRLLRTAWQPQAADELIAAAGRKPDLRERWNRAEALTDERMGELLTAVLEPDERLELLDLLRRLDAAVQNAAVQNAAAQDAKKEINSAASSSGASSAM
jgi:hypothetical protein